MRKLGLLVILSMLLLRTLAACDNGAATPAPAGGATTAPVNVVPTSPPRAASTPYTKSNNVEIILKDTGILPTNLSLPAGKVHVVVVNQGAQSHDLVIANDVGVLGKTKPFTAADGNQAIDLSLTPGQYRMYSDAPGKEEPGLTATLLVTP